MDSPILTVFGYVGVVAGIAAAVWAFDFLLRTLANGFAREPDQYAGR